MSTIDSKVWHYITPNEQTRVPRSLVVLGMRASEVRLTGGHEQTWKVAVAWFSKARKGRPAKQSQGVYWTPRDLWQAVSDHCGGSGRTVLWGHNLGYDVRISSAFIDLPALGWSLAAHNLAPRGTWLVWRRERATLVMVDTASVWPTTLASIGAWFGLGKAKMPGPDSPDGAWVAPCERDVLIVRTAVLAYLDWIESADMGNWQFTGSGMSWSTYRHKFMHHRLLVHGDAEANAAERRAMWTGRCEAYWHGTINYQEVQEWDLESAYARIARDINVPVRLVGAIGPRSAWRRALDDPDLAVLGEVTVRTAVPTVPTLHDDHILWPVGSFTTTLWDVEIRAALDDGAEVELHRGWLYRTAPALADWATWILAQLAAPAEQCPLWCKAILKHWSRALVGRFAMQYSTWDIFGAMPTLGAERRTLVDDVEGATYDLMQVGTELWRESGTVEWDQGMPAITGYIMAACRVKLWRIIQQMPPGSVLYADTDSLIFTDSYREQVDRITQIGVGEGLRLKSTYRGFSIMGPRQIVTGERVRMAGVPILAQRIGDHDYVGSVWESLDVALRSGRPAAVRTHDRAWHVTGRDRRRRGRGVGWTSPYKLDMEDSKL
jgi:hypothetical protein